MKGKIMIWVMMSLFILVTASAYEMCDWGTKEINQNCTMPTPTLIGCSNFNYTVYNFSDGGVIDNASLTLFAPDLYKFNITAPEGDYILALCDGTTMQFKVKYEEDTMILSIIMLLPMLLGLFLLIGSATMSKEHDVLKIFMFLLSMITFFVSMHLGMVSIVKYMDFPELQELIGSTIYWFGMIFGVIIMYFMMYLLWCAWNDYKMEKQKRLEY